MFKVRLVYRYLKIDSKVLRLNNLNSRIVIIMNIFKIPDQLFVIFKKLKGRVIILEGNIGVGKSSLGISIEKYLNNMDIPCKFFKEYVNEKLLAQYINDMQNYSYTYELMMLTVRIFIYRAVTEYIKTGGVAIVDRSVIGDYAFGYLQKTRGYISEDQWQLLMSVLEDEKLMEPDCLVFLDCEPEVALQRTCGRDSKAEKNYDIEYFISVKEDYNVAIEDVIQRRGIHKQIPHLHLDWNTDKECKIEKLNESVHDSNTFLSDNDVIALLLQIVEKIKESENISLEKMI